MTALTLTRLLTDSLRAVVYLAVAVGVVVAVYGLTPAL